MKKNIFVLPIIIVLLLIFLPLSIYGIINQNSDDNPNHLTKINGKLYFYSKEDKLLGTYTCESDDCAYALTSIDDEYLYYYEGLPKTVDIMNSNYVFIIDNNVIKLYSIELGKTIAKLKTLKNYGTSLEDNLLLIKNTDDLYGVFSLDTVSYMISPEYTFLGLVNNLNTDGYLKTDKVVANKNNKWYLINLKNEQISSESDMPIYDYNDNVIVYVKGNNYYLKDYDGNILTNDIITNVIVQENYIAYLSGNNVKIYNNQADNLLGFYTLTDAQKIKYDDQYIKIYNSQEEIIKEIYLPSLVVYDNQTFKTLKENAQTIVSGALNAYKAQSAYNQMCFSISWLYSNNYIALNNLKGSVYIIEKNNNIKSYIWLSNGYYYLGNDNTLYSLKGINANYITYAGISSGNYYSENCGNINFDSPDIDYKN